MKRFIFALIFIFVVMGSAAQSDIKPCYGLPVPTTYLSLEYINGKVQNPDALIPMNVFETLSELDFAAGLSFLSQMYGMNLADVSQYTMDGDVYTLVIVYRPGIVAPPSTPTPEGDMS